MPEPSPQPGAARRVASGLTIRLGPARRAGRGMMPPEELRAFGVYLNGGRRRGWKKRLALLLSTPETTIAAWASRSPGNSRPIPGAVAVAVRLMADLIGQATAQGVSPQQAALALAQRIAALGHGPVPLQQRPEPAGAGEAPSAAEPGLPPPSAEAIVVEPVQVPSVCRSA